MTSTALVLLRDERKELEALRDALADIEIYIFETWEFDKALTKDAAKRFLVIAEIVGWDMPWIDEIREWLA